ncbi:hypothetical protein CW304_28835 [Bacillus sp. UFRGS-B20]|nr:hypothetical protein CW304_28835 [Bacillus sp. UFRGS-B20]
MLSQHRYNVRRKLICSFSQPFRKTLTIVSFATDSFPSPGKPFQSILRCLLFLALNPQETNHLIRFNGLHRFEGIFHKCFSNGSMTFRLRPSIRFHRDL